MIKIIRVIEDFYPGIEKIIRDSDRAIYADIKFEGVEYPSISPSISSWAYPLFSEALGFKVRPVFDYFRKYEKGKSQPTYVHKDDSISEFTAVLSLKDDNGSLGFWELNDLKDDETSSRFRLFRSEVLNKNTCVIYDASLYHSRLPENWDREDPRLVQVFFFNRDKEEK